MSSTAYAWVATSPALSASASDITPVAAVMRQWPLWKRSNRRSYSRSGSNLSEFIRIATLSGIQPVSAFKSMFCKQHQTVFESKSSRNSAVWSQSRTNRIGARKVVAAHNLHVSFFQKRHPQFIAIVRVRT